MALTDKRSKVSITLPTALAHTLTAWGHRPDQGSISQVVEQALTGYFAGNAAELVADGLHQRLAVLEAQLATLHQALRDRDARDAARDDRLDARLATLDRQQAASTQEMHSTYAALLAAYDRLAGRTPPPKATPKKRAWLW